MSEIKITSDSTCDLSAEQLKENEIGIMPLSVMLGDESFRDGIDIVPADIFRYFEDTGELPKTAAPSVKDYEDFFRPFVDAGQTVIHFNISSKASGSNGFAQTAAQSFGGKVIVIDSLALSTGQGLLVMKACDLRREGKSAQEIADTVNALRDKVNTSFIPDTLLYLYKGGQLYPKKKYIGKMSRCLKNYVHDLAEEYPNYESTRCFITHSNADAELVEGAKALVKELFAFDEVIETVAGSIITSHCGRNTIGVLFISK